MFLACYGWPLLLQASVLFVKLEFTMRREEFLVSTRILLSLTIMYSQAFIDLRVTEKKKTDCKKENDSPGTEVTSSGVN